MRASESALDRVRTLTLVCVCVFARLFSESRMSTRTLRGKRRPVLSDTAWESCSFNVTSQTANNVTGAEQGRAELCAGAASTHGVDPSALMVQIRAN